MEHSLGHGAGNQHSAPVSTLRPAKVGFHGACANEAVFALPELESVAGSTCVVIYFWDTFKVGDLMANSPYLILIT
jgi:hypothetical protein